MTQMPVASPSADVVAGIDQAQADAAGHRRDDAGVDEVELGGVDAGLVGDDVRLVLAHQRGLGVDCWRAIESCATSVL